MKLQGGAQALRRATGTALDGPGSTTALDVLGYRQNFLLPPPALHLSVRLIHGLLGLLRDVGGFCGILTASGKSRL
jgi:hypothetical protein